VILATTYKKCLYFWR